MYGKTKTLTGRGVWGIHTYMHQNLAKMQKLSQGEGFWVSSPKTLTGRGVLKRTLNENSTIAKHVCMYLRFQNPSPCEGFFKTPLPVRGFSKPLSLWGVFQNPSPCEGFFKTPLPVRGFSKPLCLWGVFQNPSACEGFSKPLCLWGVFQNLSPCEGFSKTPLPVRGFSKVLSLWRGFSKVLSLWRVFQNPSPCEGFFCLGRKHSSLLGFQKYPPSQFKNKWTGMLQESLFQCVFEP